ncbi:MAG TPA: phosphoenolpyruvate--protein phosphotransferase [Lentisphaerae bacterium]|nr:phosphoenolpyruvate--protein phosphotransferase [Lentisphaerota bacterium]
MSDRPQQKKEIVLRGVPASPGIAVAPAVLMASEPEHYPEREISEDEIPREIARFEEALIKTRHQLHEIERRVAEAIGEENAGIFDAHLLVVDDRSFVEEVIEGLHRERKNVEVVLMRVAEKYAQALATVDGDYLRERAVDVRDVARRIVRNLAGVTVGGLESVAEPCIVVAHDLAPSDTATMPRDKVAGFVTDLGSMTSHTAIMARALAIPAVVGSRDASVRVNPGDMVLVDGTRGVVIINPSSERLQEYDRRAETERSIRQQLAELRGEPAVTADGKRVGLMANIELPADVELVLENGAEGIGLFRTEFLYVGRSSWPSEDEQVEVYEEVARRVAPNPVVIRTLDLGGDKFVSHMKAPEEANPFMGWRAIRFCLAQPEIFKVQLRAILRASRLGNIRMMYPMVSNLDELLQANRILQQEMKSLAERGVEFNRDIDVGVMIEVPSAALIADILAPHAAFFSLGTNDLVQYTLAVDRVNEKVAYLYEPTHPALIRLIQKAVEAGHGHGIQVGICGEMGGNPLMVPLLLGLGVDHFSVSPTLLPLVKRAVRSVSYSECVELVRKALQAATASEITEMCYELIRKSAPELLDLVS